MNPYPSLLNRYSCSLLFVMIILLGWGSVGLFNGNYLCIVPFLLGVLMFQGFKQPKEAMPRRVWLLTFLGQMTTVKVDKLTLLLDWIPAIKVIGYVEFTMKQVDKDITLAKPVRCQDGQYIIGSVSISVLPDEYDDPSGFVDTQNNWKTGGEKLRDFANVTGGDVTQIFPQLDDILTTWIQVIANDKRSEYMEKSSRELQETLLGYISGEKGAPHESGNSTLDDIRGFGIRIKKLQPVLRPQDKVIDSRVDIQVQNAKREAQTYGTETVNNQIAERLKLYREGVKDDKGNILKQPTPDKDIPSIAEIRAMVIQENLIHDGKVTQVINQGGLNIANVPSS